VELGRLPAFVHPDPIPDHLRHEQFSFEILHPKYVELDFQALMNSKEFLRRWGMSNWPEDDFSLEDNLADLDWHYKEQLQKIAYSYTILNHDQSVCLGCLYIRPLESIKPIQSSEKQILSAYPFFCSYWVVDDIRGAALDQHIFDNLRNWLETSWIFPAIFYTNNLLTPEQDAIYQHNGLELFLTLENENRYQQCWRKNKD
jgi:hypothetical protein